MWDFALVDKSAPDNTSYCFRILLADGSQLDTYTVIPEVTTVPENLWLFLILAPILPKLLKKKKKKLKKKVKNKRKTILKH